MGDDFADIKAAMARIPQPTIDDLLRARRETEQVPPPPPTTIPTPDFPSFGVVRFRCPLDCGWFHDERPDLEPMGSLLLPAGFTSNDLSAALTARADVEHNNFQLRVEQKIADHFAAAHRDR